jgi:non-specific serine/threonine protein kinase
MDAAAPALSIFSFGRAELDEPRRELRVDGRAVALETKPYELLRVFLRHPGETLSKDELIEAVWPGRVVTEGVLAKCVTKLRGALADDGQQVIRTVHGYGYRFVASLSTRAPAGGIASPTPRAGDALPARPHWHLVRELGQGGFGSVWLVEHDKTRERRVFKFAGDGAALQALKREITLYRLLHDTLGERAAIVRILDWNVDEPPYFIEAEYIAGGNLIEWCETQGGVATISREMRIELIARIADALAAAHAIGVLHKDLKPANVLIAGDAASPEVRLADFGSGRALEPERLAALGITRLGLTGNRADGDTTSGTLFYLAPELIAGGAATVGADIYALGVVLYQIIVGDFRQPLAPGWEREIDDELLREDISAAADLDPSRRLADAGELARRLRTLHERARARADERTAAAHALEARAQVARWRTRRQWLFVLCGVLAMASAVTVALYLRAEREAATTRAINAFLDDDLLAAANPYSNREPDLRVREVLDRASARVGERFAGRPAEEAAIRTTLGRTYAGIGDYAETRRQLSRALELVAASSGGKSGEALQLRRALADNDVEDTHYDDADKAYAALAADIAAVHGPDSDEAMTLGAARARLEMRRGHFEAAAKAIESALPRWRARFGESSDVVLDATAVLGQSYRNMARFDEAEAKSREVHEADVARFGATHWRTLQALQELAQIERARGHFDQAVALERQVLDGREKAFGRTHEETQNALNELASMLQDQKKFAEAEPIFREVLATREKTLGEQHEHTRNAMNNLALVLKQSGKLDEAEALYQRALAIERTLLGSDELDVLILEHNLAGLERERGDYPDAEALSRDVIERASRTLPAGRPETGLFLTGLGRTQQKVKHYEEAAATFMKARAILVGAYGPTHARVTKLTEMQAALYQEWGRPLPPELR